MTAKASKARPPRKRGNQTPVRALLKARLAEQVRDGLGAMKREDRDFIEEGLRSEFSDTLELDEAMKPDHPDDNRWDYLLGHDASGHVVALEPHSAKDDEIEVVIGKRRAAREQLVGHLQPGGHIADWWWVSSGIVRFADTERARRRLDQAGIKFVGKKVLRKHVEQLKRSPKN